MLLNLDVFSLVVLFGAFQGLIFSLYLFFSKEEAIRGKNFLGFFMLILAYNGFETFSWSSGIDFPYLRLFFECFSFTLIFGVGPSLFHYVKSLTREDQPPNITPSIYWPVMIRATVRLFIIAYAVLWNFDLGITGVSPPDVDLWDVRIAEPLSVLVFAVYLFISFKELKKFKANRAAALTYHPIHKEIVLKWLRIFLNCMLFFVAVWSATVLAPLLFDVAYGPHFYFVEVLLVFMIYYIAFASYYRTKVVFVHPQKSASNFVNSISPEEMEMHAASIKNAMERDKLFLDPALTVGKLGDFVQLSPKLVSAVLNNYFGKSFNDFINSYRVEEVKVSLFDSRKCHLTITGIALECGFNSQATFQRAFKNNIGVSPRKFVAAHAEKEEKIMFKSGFE